MSETLTPTARVDPTRSISLVEPMVERRSRRWTLPPEGDAAETDNLEPVELPSLNRTVAIGDALSAQAEQPPPPGRSVKTPEPVSEPPAAPQGALADSAHKPPQTPDQRPEAPAASAPPTPAKPPHETSGATRSSQRPEARATLPEPEPEASEKGNEAAPAAIRLAGFRGAVAEAGIKGKRRPGRILEAGLPRATVAASASPEGRRTSGTAASPQGQQRPLTSPVKILSKPRPLYPENALAQRLQGDVLIDVKFRYSGSVEILGVRQGLGAGLNQSAIEAARKIRFAPACKDGRPVDAQATLCIRFQRAP